METTISALRLGWDSLTCAFRLVMCFCTDTFHATSKKKAVMEFGRTSISSQESRESGQQHRRINPHKGPGNWWTGLYRHGGLDWIRIAPVTVVDEVRAPLPHAHLQ